MRKDLLHATQDQRELIQTLVQAPSLIVFDFYISPDYKKKKTSLTVRLREK